MRDRSVRPAVDSTGVWSRGLYRKMGPSLLWVVSADMQEFPQRELLSLEMLLTLASDRRTWDDMTASCPSGGEDQLREINSAPGPSSYWMGSVQPGPFFFLFFCSCSWTLLPSYSIFLNMLHFRFLHLPNNSSVQESLEAFFVGILANSQWPSASTCHEDTTSNEPFIPGLADEVRKLRLPISRKLQCIGRSTS